MLVEYYETKGGYPIAVRLRKSMRNYIKNYKQLRRQSDPDQPQPHNGTVSCRE